MSIEVKGLRFAYGERRVLGGIDFSAGEGELIALLGPNGAGKSTLMRCLLGLLKGYEGSVAIDGQDIRALSRPALSKKIAYIPQSAPAVFNYTVLELVLMGATGSIGILSAPGPEHEARAVEILKELGIERLAKRGCGEISGGERQMALLARALIQNARVLVMDEPTSNLDYGNQSRVMERVCTLTEQGYIVLFSTHDPNQALLYAGRALTLWEGRILTDGKPEDALTRDVLQTLYGINVRRCAVTDEYGGVTVCLPVRRRG